MTMTKLLLCLAPCLLLSSCGSYIAGSATPPEIAKVARSTVRMIMSTEAMRPALIQEQADVAVNASRWWQAGDGSISLRLKSSRGRTLRGVECGGHLFIAGTPGDAAKLLIRNELDRSAEVDVTVNAGATQRIQVPPHSVKEVPAQFVSVSGIDALHRYDLSAQQGVIDVDVFPNAKPEPLMPVRQVKLPVPGPRMHRYQPLASPFRYR